MQNSLLILKIFRKRPKEIRMNLIFIETFVIVALSKNMTDAADKLFTSQSTISYRLKELEHHLNIKLIKRNKGEKQTELTNEGKQLLPLAINWLNLYKRIQNFSSETSYYSLSIASVESLNMYLLGDFYKNLHLDEYDWRLSIQNLHSQEITKLTNNGLIDIGIIVSNCTDIGVVSEELYNEEIVVVSKNQELFPTQVIESSQLNLDSEIYVDWGDDYNSWRQKFLIDSYIHKWKSDSFSIAHQLLHDNYWLFAPLSICQHYPDLHYFHLKDHVPYRKIFMIYNNKSITTNLDIIDILKNKLKTYLSHNQELIKML